MQRKPTTRSAEPLVARWALAGVACAVAAFMMMFYVQLLNDSVSRGAQARYSRSTPTSPLAEAAPAPGARFVSNSR